MKKPSISQIQEYLEKYNPLDLAGASIELVNEHNHLIYKVKKEEKLYCLRMINPETYRAGEWLRIPEEYTLLKLLESSELGPKVYYVDPERFVLPLLIQDFIEDAICFNNLKPLTEEHLKATAEAIALLNSQDITPDNFPFREGYTRYSYLTSIRTWRERLATIKKSKQKDVLDWAEKIERVTDKAEKILERFEPLLQKSSPYFCLNFDGAHCGNTYWRNNRTFFFDWQKVSYGDPAFTLARFLTSATKEEGREISESDKEIMVKTYLEKREVPEFEKLIDQRLFERQTADLLWILWHYVKSEKTGPVEEETSIVQRYQTVQKLLEQY